MSAILSEFDNFPKERDLIGQILLAYGEIEFVLVGMIADALGIDNPTAARIFFRVNGEYARLQVADAILRPVCLQHKLRDKWITAFSAAKHCKNLRNQYAHCHWQLWGGKLSFLDFDEEAKNTEDDDLIVTLRPIDLPLIEGQYRYLEYSAACLYFVRDRLKRALGKPPEDAPFPEPKSIPKPPRDNLPPKDARPPEEDSGKTRA